jgi:acyl-CoA thioester hydrolase
VIVTVETVYVLVDARTLTKLPLPDALRAALQEGAAGRTTDHAGYQPRMSPQSNALRA